MIRQKNGKVSVHAKKNAITRLDAPRHKVHNISLVAWSFRHTFAGIVEQRRDNLQRAHLFGVPGYGKCVLASSRTSTLWLSPDVPFDLTGCLSQIEPVVLDRFDRNLGALTQQAFGILDARWR